MSKPDHYVPEPESVLLLRQKLLRWFRTNERDYPWRTTADPFKILIAEMMLRRTKAEQVRTVYEKLLEEYPSVNALATASAEKVEGILHNLGLHWRTPAFIEVAQQIKTRFGGTVPRTREELLSLPGVGDYVAGAVLSFAFNDKEWIVDANVVRIFRRYFGLRTTKEGRRDRHIIETAKLYSYCRVPRKANLAILDFTALICTPSNPDCVSCPIRKSCDYFNS